MSGIRCDTSTRRLPADPQAVTSQPLPKRVFRRRRMFFGPPSGSPRPHLHAANCRAFRPSGQPLRIIGVAVRRYCELCAADARCQRGVSRRLCGLAVVIRNVRFPSAPAGERPRAKFLVRSTPIACSATCSKTKHSTRVWSHSYWLPASGLQSLPPRRERRCHGRHAPSNSRRHASPRRRRRDARSKGRAKSARAAAYPGSAWL